MRIALRAFAEDVCVLSCAINKSCVPNIVAHRCVAISIHNVQVLAVLVTRRKVFVIRCLMMIHTQALFTRMGANIDWC